MKLTFKSIAAAVGLISYTLFPSSINASTSAATEKTNLRHEATGNKTGKYFDTGFFAGGERTVQSAKLKDIRRAKSLEGYERIVLDFQANGDDKNSLPYFQLQMSPSEQRMVLSVWSNIQYDFDAVKINKAFTKSTNIKRLNIMPRLEDGLSIIEFQLKTAIRPIKAEAFRLSNPSRIIIDIM